MAASTRRLRVSDRLTISTTAVLLAAQNGSRTGLIIKETGGSNAADIGDSTVKAAHGWPLAASGELKLEGGLCPTDAVYAIRSGGADATVAVFEVTE